jgi:glycine cleavage system H protein
MTDLTSLAYTAEHEWVSLAEDPESGTVATVGITDFAAGRLGDVVFVDLPALDAGVAAGEVCGEIESTKSVGELYAPLTGEIVAVNHAVVDDPSLVNSDPFGEGWLIRIRVDASVPAELLDRDAYLALTGGAA